MTPTELARAITAAAPGSTIDIPAGLYGALVLKRPVSLRGPREVLFSSVSVTATASGTPETPTTLEGFSVTIPDSDTISSATTAVKVSGTPPKMDGDVVVNPAVLVHDVVLRNLCIRGGIATGRAVEPDSDPALPRPGERVRGWVNGKGVSIQWARNVLVEFNDIGHLLKGAGHSHSQGVTFRGNDIHDCRTTPLVGESGIDILIQANHLHDCKPWAWGAPGGKGDHGDLIHEWTDPGEAPVSNLRIVDNLLDQGDGVAVLGIQLDNMNEEGPGFVGVEISRNTILLGNNQGIRCERVDGLIADNTMLQCSGGPKDAPKIIEADGTTVTISGRDSLAVQVAGPVPSSMLHDAREAWRYQRAKVLGLPDPKDDLIKALEASVADLSTQAAAAREAAEAYRADLVAAQARIAAVREAIA